MTKQFQSKIGQFYDDYPSSTIVVLLVQASESWFHTFIPDIYSRGTCLNMLIKKYMSPTAPDTKIRYQYNGARSRVPDLSTYIKVYI